MKARLWGVGHCCQDNICIIENYPQEDGSTHILNIDDSQGGGAAATAMVTAARLGMPSGIMANIGDDDTGKKIIEGLEKEGVETSKIRIKKGRSSSSIVMVNPKTGSRTKFPYHDNFPPIEFDSDLQQVIADADILHLDSSNYINALHAAQIARASGTTVSLDACSVQEDNKKNLELIKLADILITNERYPVKLTGSRDKAEELRFMSQWGAKVTAITAGEGGCYYTDGQRVCHMPAYPVRTVDTTGAGDTFHGAFLVSYMQNKDLEKSLRFASAAAALKCLKYGGRAGIPTMEELKKFMLEMTELKVQIII